MKPITKVLCVFLFLLLLSFDNHSVLATTETRYMTSTYVGWSALAMYDLNATSQSSTSKTVQDGIYDGNVYVTVYFGIRVYLNHSDKSLTEITSGVTTIVSGNTTGLLSGTWSCPQTSMVSTDRVQVHVYLSDTDPPAELELKAKFQTEALSSTVLNSATWTFYLHLLRTYTTRPVPITKYFFGFGSATYNSRIEGFKYGEATGTWHLVESWTGQLLTRSWQFVESWNGQLLTRAWQLIESWTGQLLTRIWEFVESWTGQLLTSSWKLIETWTGKLVTIGWHWIETWTGRLTPSMRINLGIVFMLLGILGGPLFLIFFWRRRKQ